MTIAVCWENAHLFGDVIPSMLRLRHRCFVERQSYDVPTHNGMEYDQYDTPASWYCMWRDEQDIVRGVARLSPTNRPYMLKDLWPGMISGSLPESPAVWEGTRFCVDKDLPAELRRKVISDLVISYAEFCKDHGIKAIVGVMPPLIWRHVFAKSGWPMEALGTPVQLPNDEKIVAGSLKFTPSVLSSLYARSGSSARRLYYSPDGAVRHEAA